MLKNLENTSIELLINMLRSDKPQDDIFAWVLFVAPLLMRARDLEIRSPTPQSLPPPSFAQPNRKRHSG